MNEVLSFWGIYLCPNKVREIVRAHVHKFIALEDENSDYCRLATVNNPLNLVAHYFTQDESHAVRMRSDYQVLYVDEG